jgi:hypothetical protein
MAVIAGVDVGNATTEVAVLSGNQLLGVDRSPTRGGKGSAESIRGAAALVRRLERRHGWRVDEARIAPLRPVETATVATAEIPPATGRLRMLAAGVGTPGGGGGCVGVPLWLDGRDGAGLPGKPAGDYVALIPAELGYAEAARRLRALFAADVPVRAVLVPGDEGVLIANRIGRQIPVVDQVDVIAAASCVLVAVEVRAPGHQLGLLADPVALAAALGLGDTEAADAVTLCRSLVDYSNAVVGCLHGSAAAGPRRQDAEPWVLAEGRKIALREACQRLAGLPVGAVLTLCAGSGPVEVDDLFAVDLAAVADDANARRGSLGHAVIAASLRRLAAGTAQTSTAQVGQLAALLGRPVRCTSTEPGAARLGALTTPGARPDAVVVDVGAGTIDVISPDAEVVAAGAGDLLTAAVAGTLGISLAAAEWVKRGPCLRVEGAQRFEAEDGSRGFLDRPAPASAAGMLAATGPAGLLPFGRDRSPAEWRAIRLRLKQAVFAVNLRRALAGLEAGTAQILIVGGAAADEELLGAVLRSLPAGASAGRGNVGGMLAGPPAGHRYAAAVGLALGADAS